MASIFTKIINREIPAFIIAENDDCIAFLDAFPLNRGHVLVVPKKEVDKLFDLDIKTYQSVMTMAQKIGAIMENLFDCKRIGMAVIGLEVPHAHVHLTPISSMDDLNFGRKKLKFTTKEYQEITDKFKKVIN